MAVLVGLLVAALFGSGDFLGGIASRRASTLVVLATAQVCALVGAVLVATLAGGEPRPEDFVLGAAAGLVNVTALGCLFRGLAIGRIGQVAPIAAVIGATIPVAWGLLTGERPGPVALCGVALAVVAGALIARERDDGDGHDDRRALLFAIAAGVGFGASFVLFASTDHDSGFWPVLSARAAAAAGVFVVVAITRTSLRADRAPRLQAVASGLFDVSATALLLVSVRVGLTAVVAPVASLAPGFTVGHAWWYLHERPTRVQKAGVVVALAGLVLIALG
ncbi:DMT family transporter [Dermatobacter hominis]|uniref:DMT family transporter n=1 Tax=Dermatobacter hominis TaxID=2884263 RepID=UPI001D104137|nr:DMT family transporter [Dermatobacter hominis]UDY35867.1 DMT family transporter [Dermatobacter hominis]